MVSYYYAKDINVNWEKRYLVNIDEDSWYKESIDEHGFPEEYKFSKQVEEEYYHKYCDVDKDNFFE